MDENKNSLNLENQSSLCRRSVTYVQLIDRSDHLQNLEHKGIILQNQTIQSNNKIFKNAFEWVTTLDREYGVKTVINNPPIKIPPLGTPTPIRISDNKNMDEQNAEDIYFPEIIFPSAFTDDEEIEENMNDKKETEAETDIIDISGYAKDKWYDEPVCCSLTTTMTPDDNEFPPIRWICLDCGRIGIDFELQKIRQKERAE